MSRQSNTYIIFFVIILCVVIGGLLAGASTFLAPAQKKSIDLATKSQILGAVGDFVTINPGDDVLALYNERISSIVVDYSGKEIEGVVAENVDVSKNFKLDPKERVYPVFRLKSKTDPKKFEAYILPIYGNGLWDKIWGYVALDEKVHSIVGVVFDHKGETPGLGQRIATDEIQNRFKGKEIYENGVLVSVEMMKGEHGGKQSSIDYYKEAPHKVDGMSGATLTGRGVNEMLKSYLASYRNYFKTVAAGTNSVATTE